MKKLLLVIIFLNLILLSNFSDAQVRFQKAYGAGQFNCIIPVASGGYIMSGGISNGGSGDVKVVRISETGDTLWTRAYSTGTGRESGGFIEQTKDGGFIIAGSTNSVGAGGWDGLLLKIDSSGTLMWSKAYGGPSIDQFNSVHQTSDGGYLATGQTGGYIGGCSFILVRTNSTGDTLWTKVIGTSHESAYACAPTSDGGYILSGSTAGMQPPSSIATFLVKTDSAGNTSWSKCYAGLNIGEGYNVRQTSDGGYIVTGYVYTGSTNSYDALLIKTNSTGDTLWTKTFGGTGDDKTFSVKQTSDGGYFLSGYSYNSFNSTTSVFSVKTNTAGNVQWSKIYGPTTDSWLSYDLMQSTDKGYLMIGSGQTAFVVKTETGTGIDHF